MSYKTLFAALTLGAATALTSLSVLADQAGQITVSNPYAREVPPGAPASASFMTLKNGGNSDVTLVAGESEISQVVELHTHTHDHGVMRMRKIPSISVPANGQTELKPGGLHIMLINPHQPLKAGQTVEVTLKFEDGSQKTVSMPVKSLMEMNMNRTNHSNHSMH